MSRITIIKKSNENLRSSVYNSYEYGCNYSIADSKESMIRRRGFHMTNEEIKNMLHNLPEEFKSAVRFIKDESQVKAFTEVPKETKENFEDVKEKMAKVIQNAKEQATKKVEEIKVLALDILNKDHSKLSDEELLEYKNQLKEFAKTNDIKIHPALKDVDKIKEIITNQIKESI